MITLLEEEYDGMRRQIENANKRLRRINKLITDSVVHGWISSTHELLYNEILNITLEKD